LACAGMALVVIEAMTTSQIWTSATRSRRKADRKKGKKAAGPAPPPRENSPRSALVLAVSCLVSGLLLAFSRTLWSFATIAEGYTLTSLLILVIFLLMFRWRRLFSEASRRPAKPASQEGKSGSSASGDSTGDDRSSLSRPVAWSSTHRYL